MNVRRAAIAVASVAVLSIPVMLIADRPSADAAPSLSEVESKAAAARAKEAVLTSEISKYSARIRGVETRLAPIEARLNQLNAEVAGLESRRKQLTEEVDAEQRRLDILVARLNNQREALGKRLSSAYRRGDPSVIQILVQSGSLSTAISARENLERAMVGDEKLIQLTRKDANTSLRLRKELQAKRNEVWQNEKRTKEARAEQKVTFDRVNSEKVNLEVAKQSRTQLLAKVKGDRRVLEKEATNLRARSLRLQNEINRANASLPPTTTVSGNGTFAWPVSGSVTSPFGPRWGRMHEGIDIASPGGTPIGASADGTVVVAGWQGGYGNLVVVSHGSLSTAYAHMSRVGVSVGQHVTRGQTLGAVGCTGHCYGDHVHFEVRTSSGAVNPIPYM